MVSILLQLMGSAFLSWNAITKTLRSRAMESQSVIGSSIGVDKPTAYLKQREHYLSIFGFSILFIGYMIQLLDFDFSFITSFDARFVITISLFFYYLVYLFIDFLARLNADSLQKSTQIPEEGKEYLYFGELGRAISKDSE